VSASCSSNFTIEQFEAGEIAPDAFDHEAHVHIAWLYVRTFELAEAIHRFSGALRRLTTRLGVSHKYHATITWLFLLLIADRSRKNESWQSFRSRNSDLIKDCKSTLSSYYSDALLFSKRARQRFVLPDRLPS
jgi:hypothetical protein